ncbi:PstA family ABC transporter permease [Infirmifilum sp. NZ]|uniref:PstA family ABC transporter permease n=1 Tax=Infirmifilum sp. NZ TaxID=2926850 RepID=UPI000CB7204F|nr:ABC transporter permease subunit [Infirmifilum sp. NZ]PLJ77992.1 MAG: hypothetical protein B7L53_02890 [Thermofilum sp. NZ13]UNQ73078.1 ABC transporter permease subunit [Infirmifilum sp. NZ]
MRLRRAVADRAFLVYSLVTAVTLLAVILHIAFSSILSLARVLVAEGLGFFVLPPGEPGGSVGGLGPVILNTAIMTALALAFSAPVGVAVGVYLGEERMSRLASIASATVQMLAEIPTVIIGLFVFATICLSLKSYSLLAGAVSLAITVLPFVIEQVKEAVTSIPEEYREAAYALDLPRWKTVWLVLVPMCRTGIASGVLLGYTKALGETAPVLLTAGFALYGFYGLTGPSSTLSLVVYRFAMMPYENLRSLAWAASGLLLIASVALTYLVGRLAGEVKF